MTTQKLDRLMAAAPNMGFICQPKTGINRPAASGMPIIFRAAMKPTPSIFKEQDSVDMISMTNKKLSIKGRHDPCVVVRAVPVFEAAAAIAITDILLDNRET